MHSYSIVQIRCTSVQASAKTRKSMNEAAGIGIVDDFVHGASFFIVRYRDGKADGRANGRNDA